MRKLCILTFVLLACSFVACQKDQAGKGGDDSKFTFTATIADDETKVTYKEETVDSKIKLKPTWSKNDKIIGFDNNGKTYTFEAGYVSDDGVAKFERVAGGTAEADPAPGTKMYMFYAPGKTAEDITSKSLTVSIASQSADNGNSVPALMMASGTVGDSKLSLTFVNKTAIIGIKNPTMAAASTKYSSIALSGTGINTTVTFSLSGETLQAEYGTEGTITKTVDFTSDATTKKGPAVTYIVACPLGTSAELTFTTNNGETFSKSGKTIEAGKYYYMTPTFIKKGHESVQLWSGGPYWATCNIGAESETDYGWYFAWGYAEGCVRNSNNDGWVLASDGTTEKEFNITNFPNRISSDISSDFVDAAAANWGSPWKLPTKDELNNLKNNCTVTYVTTGVKGIRFTGKDDYSNKSIFLPAAGYGDGSGLYDAGIYGYYWSSVQGNSNYAYGLGFNPEDGSLDVYNFNKYFGYTVRPVRSSQ